MDSIALFNECLDLFRTGFVQGFVVAILFFFGSYALGLAPRIVKYILK